MESDTSPAVGLIEEFEDCAIRTSGRIRLFQARDAIRIVARARERRVPIYGIDGFIAWTDGIQPYLEHTLDVEGAEDPWRAASEFLAEYRDTSFVFEFSLGDGDA